MATVTGYTAEEMDRIARETVTSGQVDSSGHLILGTRGGVEFDAGLVKGRDATPLLSVLDSDSVDLVLTGLGTAESPWNLTAEVKSMTASSIVRGLLEAGYRGGPARVRVGGSLSSEAYPWMTPYIPNASREVNLMKVGTSWVILGQTLDSYKVISLNLSIVRLYNDVLNNALYTSIARAQRLPSGIVHLSGLLRMVGTPATQSTMGFLPEGCRPDTDIIVPVRGATGPGLLLIKSDGEIRNYGAYPSNSYVTLDGIAFPAAGVADWIPVTSWGPKFDSRPESDWHTVYGVPSYWKDSYGFVWTRGLVRVVTTPVDNDNIFSLPPEYSADKPQHIKAGSINVFGSVQHSPGGFDWKTGSPNGGVGNWISLAGIFGVTTEGRLNNPWQEFPAFVSPWVNNSSAQPSAQYLLREDGLRALGGLIRGGTSDSKITSMAEEEMWPSRGKIILTTVSNGADARLDIKGLMDASEAGSLVANITNGSSWFSLDSKCWVS